MVFWPSFTSTLKIGLQHFSNYIEDSWPFASVWIDLGWFLSRATRFIFAYLNGKILCHGPLWGTMKVKTIVTETSVADKSKVKTERKLLLNHRDWKVNSHNQIWRRKAIWIISDCIKLGVKWCLSGHSSY